MLAAGWCTAQKRLARGHRAGAANQRRGPGLERTSWAGGPAQEGKGGGGGKGGGERERGLPLSACRASSSRRRRAPCARAHPPSRAPPRGLGAEGPTRALARARGAATHLLQLLHQVHVGVQPPGRVSDEHIHLVVPRHLSCAATQSGAGPRAELAGSAGPRARQPLPHQTAGALARAAVGRRSATRQGRPPLAPVRRRWRQTSPAPAAAVSRPRSEPGSSGDAALHRTAGGGGGGAQRRIGRRRRPRRGSWRCWPGP